MYEDIATKRRAGVLATQERMLVMEGMEGRCQDCRQWTHALCDGCGVTRCNDCENRHHCDTNIALNWKTIEEITRPCPGCRAPIQKSSGCYQMWCIVCRTAFDWTSGERLVVTERFHNPHHQQDTISSCTQQQQQLIWEDFYRRLQEYGRTTMEQKRWQFFFSLIKSAQDTIQAPNTDNDPSKRWRSLLRTRKISIDLFEKLVQMEDDLSQRRCWMKRLLKEFISRGKRLILSIQDDTRWTSCHHEMNAMIEQFNHENEIYPSFLRIRAFRLSLIK